MNWILWLTVLTAVVDMAFLATRFDRDTCRATQIAKVVLVLAMLVAAVDMFLV
jgi:hypothetical protein